jgi:hypothetical protein
MEAVIERAEKAELNYRWMVERVADQKLDGYRELGQRAAKAEERADRAKQERNEARRTALIANVVDTWAWMPGGTDGENDLASMSDDTVVTMTAGTLRMLLNKEESNEPTSKARIT